MKNELVPATRQHTFNMDKEMMALFEFFGIDPHKDALASAVFASLVGNAQKKKGTTTREIAENTGATQAAIAYHMRKFVEMGFAEKRGRNYFMRGDTLGETLSEMEADYLRRMDRAKKMARRIDEYI